jgi:hypothetical protein
MGGRGGMGGKGKGKAKGGGKADVVEAKAAE